MAITNATFSGNRANLVGGAIAITAVGVLARISFATLAQNQVGAAAGAALHRTGGNVFVKNSIVSGTTDGAGNPRTHALLPGSRGIDFAVDCTDATGATARRAIPLQPPLLVSEGTCGSQRVRRPMLF